MTRVGILGAAGRMGRAMAEGLSAAGFEVTALVDRQAPPGSPSTWRRSLAEIDPASLDALVDFSTPAATREGLEWALGAGVLDVIGTTGLDPGEVDGWAERVAAANGRVVYSANYSLGATLAQRFSREAAAHFARCEIIELHHDNKRDAPSGTAMATARAVAEARREAGLDEIVDTTENEGLVGARGGEGAGGVRIHSVRLPGLVAHQEIIFGGPGEGLTIRHDSYDRVSFVAGVTLALRVGLSRPGLTVGLEPILFP